MFNISLPPFTRNRLPRRFAPRPAHRSYSAPCPSVQLFTTLWLSIETVVKIFSSPNSLSSKCWMNCIRLSFPSESDPPSCVARPVRGLQGEIAPQLHTAYHTNVTITKPPFPYRYIHPLPPFPNLQPCPGCLQHSVRAPNPFPRYRAHARPEHPRGTRVRLEAFQQEDAAERQGVQQVRGERSEGRTVATTVYCIAL